MRARRPDMGYVEVADRGHVPFLDEPEVVAAVGAFLGRAAGMTDISRIRAAAARARGAGAAHAAARPRAALDAGAGRRVWSRPSACRSPARSRRAGPGRRSRRWRRRRGRAGCWPISSGNHAQGVAWAAAAHGAPAVILMPEDAPAVKIEGTRALGAEVVLYDRLTRGPRGARRRELAAARGLTLIPPYDHPEVIAGQGTTGLEIAAHAAEAGIARGRRAGLLRRRRARLGHRAGAVGRGAGAPGAHRRARGLRRHGALARRAAGGERTRAPTGLDLRRDPDAAARAR